MEVGVTATCEEGGTATCVEEGVAGIGSEEGELVNVVSSSIAS